ncbi:MAG TPA: alpha/beta hydrolase [Thermoleophilaceae bacterium]
MKAAMIGAAGAAGALLLNRELAGRETRPPEAGAGRIVGELHVVDEGHPVSPPAVLLHGFAGSLHWFDRFAPLLASDHRVVRIDLLGHGGSAKPATEYTIERQAEALAETLSQLGTGPALFVGHSFGGAVAVALAERDSRFVERLVILDEGPSNEFGDQSLTTKLGFVPVIGELMHRIAFGSAIRDGYRDAFAEGFDIASGFDDPDQVVRDYQAMTFGSYKGSWDGEESFLAARRLDERVRDLGLPTLMIFGEHDSFFRAGESAEAFRRVPGVRVEVLDGIGHSPAVESPDAVARLVREFAPVAAG